MFNKLTAQEELEQRIDQVHREAGEGYVEVGPRSRTSRTGSRRTVFTGAGMEFFQAKQFFWGSDDPRTMLSRAAARSNGDVLYCRVNKPETQTTVYALFDISRTLDFGYSRESKLWLLARSAVTACFSLKATQDLIMPALYANNEISWRTLRATSPALVSRKLAGLILDPVYSTGRLESGLSQALNMVPARGKCEVLLMSDFLNLTADQAAQLAEVSRKNSVRALILQDQRERYLPEPPSWWPFPAPLRVFDMTTGKQYSWWLTRGNRQKYTAEFEAHERKLRQFFTDNGIHYQVVNTNEGQEATAKVVKLLSLPPLHR